MSTGLTNRDAMIRANAFARFSTSWFYAKYFDYGVGHMDGLSPTYDGLPLKSLESISKILKKNGWDGTVRGMDSSLSHIAITELFWKTWALDQVYSVSPSTVQMLLTYINRLPLNTECRAIVKGATQKLAVHYDSTETILEKVYLAAGRNDLAGREDRFSKLIGIELILAADRQGVAGTMTDIFGEVFRASKSIAFD